MQSGDDPNKPTITAAQAATQAQQYVKDLIVVFPAEATLEQHGDVLTGPCANPSGVGFDKRVQASVDYWIRGLDAARYHEYFDAMKAWLPAGGWTIDTDSRPKDMFLHANRADDEFTLTLQANNKGGLSIGAASPCVWPNGTPDPTSH